MAFHDEFRNSTVTNLTYATSCRHGRFHRRLRCANLLCLADRPRCSHDQRVASGILSARQPLPRPPTAHCCRSIGPRSSRSLPVSSSPTVSNDGIGGTLVVVELTN